MMNNDGHRPVRPERLLPGDRIGIVAPSSAFDDTAFWKGIDILREMGFLPVIPETLFQTETISCRRG